MRSALIGHVKLSTLPAKTVKIGILTQALLNHQGYRNRVIACRRTLP
jgi:hypothetical protein